MAELLPALLAVPILSAAFILAAESHLPRRFLELLTIANAGFMVFATGFLGWMSRSEVLVYWFGGWKKVEGTPVGVAFALDSPGCFVACMACFLGLSALIFAWSHYEAVGGLFHALALLFLTGVTGFCLTADLFNMFIFFEMSSVAAYALTAYRIERPESLQGGLSFAVVNTLGGVFMLWGVSLVYARTGALNLAEVGRLLAHQSPDPAVRIAFALLLVGMLVKAGIVPFHFAQADAHTVAPTPMLMLLSGIFMELGVYGLARIYWSGFSEVLASEQWCIRNLLLSLGALTAVTGAVMCLLQDDLRRLLAFSTISHLGILLVGVGLFTPLGLAATGLYMLGHGPVKAGLFLCSGAVRRRCGTSSLERLRGSGRRLPAVGAMFVLFSLALSGLPFLTLHQGKSLLEEAGHHAIWLILVVVGSGSLTAGACLGAAWRIFRGEPSPEAKRSEISGVPRGLWLALGLLLLPTLLLDHLEHFHQSALHAAARFAQPELFRYWVLHTGTYTAVVSPDPGSEPGLLIQLLPGLIALLVAGAGGRVPSRWAPALKALHSGKVTDYICWTAAGAALVCVVLSS